MAEGTQEALHAIDYEARGLAREAATLIASHERVCTERWGQARASSEELKKAINGLFRHMWAAAVGIITMLLTIIGWLLTHHGLT